MASIYVSLNYKAFNLSKATKQKLELPSGVQVSGYKVLMKIYFRRFFAQRMINYTEADRLKEHQV